jgi:hypothetical protein
MRPRSTVTRGLLSAARRHKSTGGNPSNRPFSLEESEPAPFKRTALGTLPDSVPEKPLHLDQLSPRRMKFYQRTINKDRLSEEDETRLEEAMSKTQLPERRTIDFVTNESGSSVERFEWFGGVEEEGTIEAAEEIAGIEAGHLIEVRR